MRAISPFLFLATVVLAVPHGAASEPGQPLDCSDWVFLKPGLSCSTLVSYPCLYPGTNETRLACVLGTGARSDSLGGRLYPRITVLDFDACGTGDNLARTELLVIHPDGSETILAYLEDRCVGSNGIDIVRDAQVSFDAMNGRVFIGHSNRSTVQLPSSEHYSFGYQSIAIDGMATTFEILQSYEPAPNVWSFRVPYMPEGFPAADYFDTYYGDLASVGDWGKVQPLQCGFPSTAPSVGDYLTVADPLPNPGPNAGRYYVTAVNHQGQRRYGRQRVNGVLSGRDPAVLPGCLHQ